MEYYLAMQRNRALRTRQHREPGEHWGVEEARHRGPWTGTVFETRFNSIDVTCPEWANLQSESRVVAAKGGTARRG